MVMTLEAWEDSGAETSGHGTVRAEVENVGHKNSGLDETYYFGNYPIVRPSPGSDNETDGVGKSFHKYTYFKFTGTYPAAAQVRVKLIDNGEAGLSLNEYGLGFEWMNVTPWATGTPYTESCLLYTSDAADE